MSSWVIQVVERDAKDWLERIEIQQERDSHTHKVQPTKEDRCQTTNQRNKQPASSRQQASFVPSFFFGGSGRKGAIFVRSKFDHYRRLSAYAARRTKVATGRRTHKISKIQTTYANPYFHRIEPISSIGILCTINTPMNFGGYSKVQLP